MLRLTGYLQRVFLGLLARLLDHAPSQIAQIERRAIDAQLPALDPRNIKQRRDHTVEPSRLSDNHVQCALVGFAEAAHAQRAALE